MQIPPFIEKLTVRNFRSLRDVTVTFANPTFFVGKNASGKSNFIDVFAFLSDCMNRSLLSAVDERGGIRQLGYIFMESSDSIEFRVDFSLDTENKMHGYYAFALNVGERSSFRIAQEQGFIERANASPVWFDRIADDFRTNIPGIRPFINSQMLALPRVGGIEDFDPLMQHLITMHTYVIDPDVLRSPSNLEGGSALDRKGADVIRILSRLPSPERLDRLNELVASVVPGLQFAGIADTKDGRGVLVFDQDTGGSMPIIWDATRLSDGTLKAFALTTALQQEPAPALIAIEEPEAHIHPGILDSIAEKLDIAALRSQIVITTHSPDLLNTKWIEPKHLRVVHWEQASTSISELGNRPIKALQSHLMGAGELLRADALDAATPTKTSPRQSIFEELS